MENIKAVNALRNPDFAKKILEMQNPEQVKEAFKEKGVEISVEEINLMSEIVNTVLESKDLNCLNSEELSKVSGGYLGSVFKGAIMGTPIGTFLDGEGKIGAASGVAAVMRREEMSSEQIKENRKLFTEGTAKVISSGLCAGLLLAPASYKLGKWLRNKSK